MKHRAFFCLALVLLLAGALVLQQPAAAQGARQAPIFQVEPNWLKLPNNWIMGVVSAVAVDKHDNVWVMHRPRDIPEAQRSKTAPSVLEFDASGKFIQAWGYPTMKDQLWPGREHCMWVDQGDNVWIGGTWRAENQSDDYLQKLTPQGKLILQIGKPNSSTGPRDMINMNGPADVFVYEKTKEVFVGDEGNLRVAVYDANTGKFKRMWTAFGEMPPEKLPVRQAAPPAAPGTPAAPPKLETEGPGPRTWGNVHSVQVSNDDTVYVADRANRRIQVFTLDGKYVTQVFINRAGPASATASGISFSRDPEQRFMYVSDFGNHRIVVMDRKSLTVLYQFGKEGTAPGDMRGPHILAVDSKNNLFVTEVEPGNRLQKFVYKGLGTPPTTQQQ
jgi:DNA-binding beta-propeller fold protein YncE